MSTNAPNNNLCLIDARFNYTYDRPFDSPQKQKLTQDLREYLLKHEKVFRDVDWIKDSRSYNIPINAKLFGKPCCKTLADNPTFNYNVCDTLNRINKQLSKPFTKSLTKYIENSLIKEEEKNIDPNPSQPVEETSSYQSNVDNSMDDENNILMRKTDEQQFTYKNSNEITTYDLTPCKTITYDQLCSLCKNVARTELIVTVAKDENVLFAENREKQRLRRELKKYLKNNEISTKINTNIDELSVIQLQQALDDAKEIYETIKVTDLITKGINLFELGCNYVFPNGIKIPKKNKVIKLNGVGESINKLLFDRNSPLNIAYNNIIEKYDFHVSDGFLCGISILQILASKINIEDIGDNQHLGDNNKELIEDADSDEDGTESDEESGDEDGSESGEEESGDDDDESDD
jgi:type III secretory pathway component EscR